MDKFILFILLLILLHKLNKSIKEQQGRQEEEPSEEEIRDYFKTLGFPVPEEETPKLKQEKLKEKLIVKREIKTTEKKVADLKPTVTEAPYKPLEETQELPSLTQDKLEEGIILSEILGPPKAYQSRRGGGIGIRAGLKNR